MNKRSIINKDAYLQVNKGKIIILSASSGAGKTTLIHALYNYFKDKICLERVITYTTRLARKGEIHGEAYYFISPEQFKQKIDEGFFLEWSSAYGAYYGSPRYLLDRCDQGQSFLIVLDREGVLQLLSTFSHYLVTIWLSVDLQLLQSRLHKRGSETLESYDARIKLAQEENERELNEPIFSYHVKNDNFDQAFNDLIKIITKELEVII